MFLFRTKLCSLTEKLKILISICLVINVLSANCWQRTRKESSKLRDLQLLAEEHRTQMKTSCHIPRQQVFYPKTGDPSKGLIPRGTLLYRCNQYSGCCSQPSYSCQPIETETVEKVFYVYKMKALGTSKANNHEMDIAKIKLINHTKCACLPIDTQTTDSFIER